MEKSCEKYHICACLLEWVICQFHLEKFSREVCSCNAKMSNWKSWFLFWTWRIQILPRWELLLCWRQSYDNPNNELKMRNHDYILDFKILKIWYLQFLSSRFKHSLHKVNSGFQLGSAWWLRTQHRWCQAPYDLGFSLKHCSIKFSSFFRTSTYSSEFLTTKLLLRIKHSIGWCLQMDVMINHISLPFQSFYSFSSNIPQCIDVSIFQQNICRDC